MLTEVDKIISLNKLAKPYYSIDEVAELLEVHPNTIRNHIKAGILTAGKAGRQWRISRDDFITYLKARN